MQVHQTNVTAEPYSAIKGTAVLTCILLTLRKDVCISTLRFEFQFPGLLQWPMVHQITLPTQRKYIEILVTNMRITVISIDLHGASKVKLDVTNYGRFVFNYSYLTSVSHASGQVFNKSCHHENHPFVARVKGHDKS